MTAVALAYPWTGPDGVAHAPDEVVDVDDATATDLVSGGHGRYVEAPIPGTEEPLDASETHADDQDGPAGDDHAPDEEAD